MIREKKETGNRNGEHVIVDWLQKVDTENVMV